MPNGRVKRGENHPITRTRLQPTTSINDQTRVHAHRLSIRISKTLFAHKNHYNSDTPVDRTYLPGVFVFSAFD